MSLKANYYKLGVFVVGAVLAGMALLVIVGSGRWFEPKITIETYFDESVQGLDIGSKVKYRGVVIGDVTRITFTYVTYQLDRPVSQRLRYVLVEAELEPKLLGGKAAGGEITSPENAKLEAERGLRARLAPQGITGTNYLEIDYVDPPPPPLPIDWIPIHVYVPSAESTVMQFVNAASALIDRLQQLDVEGTVENLNRMLVTLNQRVDGIDTAGLSRRFERSLERAETALSGLQTKKLSAEGVALLAELRSTNAELRKTLGNPSWQKLPDDAAAALARVRSLIDDPTLPRTLHNLSRTLTRVDRLLGGGEADLATTIDNLRQITDNLRDLTEDTKRYPANVLYGEPPRPLEDHR